MRSLAELFLYRRAELSSSLESSTGQEPHKIVGDFINGVRDSYLGQDDCPDCDKEIAPSCFELISLFVRSGALPQAQTDTLFARTERFSAHSATTGSLAGVVLVLAIIAIGSVILGTTILSVLLVIGLGALGYLAAGGVIFGRSTKDWPLSLVFRKSDPVGKTDAAVRELAEENNRTSISNYLTGIEWQFRQIDTLLARFREKAAPEPLAGGEVHLNSIHLEFLQDLSEAAATQDSTYAVAVARKRLPAVVRSLGLQLTQFADGSEGCFAIDEERDAKLRGTTLTVRPAILRGDTCLVRGYARRYV